MPATHRLEAIPHILEVPIIKNILDGIRNMCERPERYQQLLVLLPWQHVD